jgi:lysophospholipase L1-like esterase
MAWCTQTKEFRNKEHSLPVKMAVVKGLKVQLFGHSFVKRLKDYIQNDSSQRHDLNLQGNALVQYSGFPGATVKELRRHLEVVSDFSPDILVLIIGTIDIYNSDVTPESVARDIENLIDTLLFVIGVGKVIVLQVLHRQVPLSHTRYPVDVDWFNARVDNLNSHLIEMLNRTGHGRSYLWRMKGFWSPASKQQNFADDGCHLSSAGQLRLITNVRAAVVAALKGSICHS